MQGHWTDHLPKGYSLWGPFTNVKSKEQAEKEGYRTIRYTGGKRPMDSWECFTDMNGPLQEAWVKASIEDLPLLITLHRECVEHSARGVWLKTLIKLLQEERTP